MNVTVEVRCATFQLRFPASSIFSENLLGAVIPNNVGWWLQGTTDDATQYDGTPRFHIPVGVSNKLGSWHCEISGKEQKRSKKCSVRWEINEQ